MPPTLEESAAAMEDGNRTIEVSSSMTGATAKRRLSRLSSKSRRRHLRDQCGKRSDDKGQNQTEDVPMMKAREYIETKEPDETAYRQSIVTTGNESKENILSTSLRRNSSTACTSANTEVYLDDTAASSITLELSSATAVSNIQVGPVEVIEIDDSESETETETTTKTSSLKRKYFFPEGEHGADSNETEQFAVAPTTFQHSLDYPYSNKSSAYVQHIAEACTLIMTDARWRTCNKRNCSYRRNQGNSGCNCQKAALFSWENGNDLSAVKAFMSLFDEKNPEEEKTNTQNEYDDDQLVFERAMHLYSRMFHRKGPWFDLTDLYSRYYAPKKQNQHIHESEAHENDSCQEVMPDNNLDSAQEDSMQRRRNFFTPKSSGRCTPSSRTKSSEDLSRHRVALELLFTDINRLLSMGLVRTFDSEYECGCVAGNIDASSKRGTFLVADERREVLRRLGGGKSPKATASTNNSGAVGSTNEILAQMQKQQSMFSSYSSSNELGRSSSQTLLPVKKHVDCVLTRKLAVRLASLISGGESITKPLKSDIDEAYQMIKNARMTVLKMYGSSRTSVFLKDQVSTLRLRESPLITLRRLLRIHLIASGGPGNMRGDGTNGWLNVPTRNDCRIPDQWHHVIYPGLSSRLGISSFELMDCYTKVLVHRDPSASAVTQFMTVFQHHFDFGLFEMGVEIRSFVDNAMEIYETNRSNRRKQMQSLEREAISHIDAERCKEVYDQFDILTEKGRTKFIERVFALHDLGYDATLNRLIELDIVSLHEEEDEIDDFTDDTERMIVAIAIICHRVLQHRMLRCTQDLKALCTRPWLRHFSFDSILAYVIWDCIPVLERNGKYHLAISCLLTILFGSTHTEIQANANKIADMINLNVPYVQFLLPRRNRGKAFERLIIDLTHIDRALKKREKASKQKSDTTPSDKQSPIQRLIKCIIDNTSSTGSIPFCFIRSLAKRLKVPLHQTMKGVPNEEIVLLGLRLVNDGNFDESKPSGYSDWSPTVDYSVANALSNGDNPVLGQRCSFVSWDTNGDDTTAATRSLNVEELALDMYNQGLLPADGSLNNGGIKGGFVGWHCEGSHLRAIFRIFCLQDLLGHSLQSCTTDMHDNIFLTPYQASPYDLHVGMQSTRFYDEDTDDPVLLLGRSFYERRRDTIDAFLEKLTHLDSQSICNNLHGCIQRRYLQHKSVEGIIADESLQRDMRELRSLSCVAAGLGGKVLASVFRSLCFDYRHYSGGLPDILLIRAQYANSDGPSSLVNLGDWIGEEFAKDNIEKGCIQRAVSMLKDDEFLGCSKNGDGLVINARPQNSNTQKVAPNEPVTSLPPKLILIHDGKDVAVDTILVEVKSANDRLDLRQEDWLNILDVNARVCKFENKNTQKKKRMK